MKNIIKLWKSHNCILIVVLDIKLNIADIVNEFIKEYNSIEFSFTQNI